MDLYRYFHPHHNPRLRNVPVRQLELGELEQAARELKNAVVRAQIRTTESPIGAIRSEHFSELIVALDFLIESLSTISSAHPGDDTTTLEALLEERKNAAGWENWAGLLKERLELMKECELTISQPKN